MSITIEGSGAAAASVGALRVTPPNATPLDKTAAQKLAAQYQESTANGTTEATARALARTVHTDAAALGVNLSLSQATEAVNTAIAQTTGQGGGFFATPTTVAAQRADVTKAVATYHQLASDGTAQATVQGLAATVATDVGTFGLDASAATVGADAALVLRQTAGTLNLVG